MNKMYDMSECACKSVLETYEQHISPRNVPRKRLTETRHFEMRTVAMCPHRGLFATPSAITSRFGQANLAILPSTLHQFFASGGGQTRQSRTPLPLNYFQTTAARPSPSPQLTLSVLVADVSPASNGVSISYWLQ